MRFDDGLKAFGAGFAAIDQNAHSEVSARAYMKTRGVNDGAVKRLNGLSGRKPPQGSDWGFLDIRRRERPRMCFTERRACTLHVQCSAFYRDGEEVWYGGYNRTSQRWCDMRITEVIDLCPSAEGEA